MMNEYLVTITAVYRVEAESVDQAKDLAESNGRLIDQEFLIEAQR